LLHDVTLFRTLTEVLIGFLTLTLSMAVHIGKKIREEIQQKGISVSVFAKKINRSRNVVYDIFGRESIDTELLGKIGKVLGFDFFSLYSSQKEYQHLHKNNVLNDQQTSYVKQQEEVKQLKQQNETLLNEIAYLKKILALMEAKKKKK
jgi:transcriptional regulator with XRE-family HTH domain